jgi:thiosulfate dehydrogenase [quinone] large subunit
MPYLSRAQATGLILLRTLIGWHFLYEGYYKLLLPGWTRGGVPLASWSAAGYMKAATGPLAGLVKPLASSGAIVWIDILIPLGLLLVGLSLVLGLFTRAGAWGALGFLTLFYLTAIPTTGVPQPGQEGTYLLVSKNLIEWAAVFVLITFRTGEIAGLDALWTRRGVVAPAPAERTVVALQ